MTSLSDTSAQPATRKHDGEIITARQQPAWLAFEAGIHQNDALRARVARSLDRFGLGTSTATVDEALDYLINKELGQSARYFNQTGKPQFNQQQISHAVLSFMAGKEQQRHMTDLAIHEEDHDDASPEGVRACHLADDGHIRPDEYAARRDALRAIAAMIPEPERELYDLMLAVREPGMLTRIHSYADKHGIGQSTVYFRIKKLAEAIQLHPWFEEVVAPFRHRQTA
jgi:alkylation response protein AidB-like acyl-CoA dehydrogenase